MMKVNVFNPTAIGKIKIDDKFFIRLNQLSLDLLSSGSIAEDYPVNDYLTLRGGEQRRVWPLDNMEWFKIWAELQAREYQQCVYEQTGSGDLNLVPRLVNAWTITQPEHSYQVTHTHPYGHISGNLYLEIPQFDRNSAETDGCISFILDRTPDVGSSRFIHVPPEQGMLLIFPSWVPHQVYPWQGTGNRRVIAWDCQLLPQ